MNLAMLELLEIVDPMHPKVLWKHTKDIEWQERDRTGEDALAWDHIGLADNWKGWSN